MFGSVSQEEKKKRPWLRLKYRSQTLANLGTQRRSRSLASFLPTPPVIASSVASVPDPASFSQSCFAGKTTGARAGCEP